MKIVDLGEYSMAIKENPREPLYRRNIKDIYNFAKDYGMPILVDKGNQITFHYLKSSDCLYSGKILLLYFKDKIPSEYQVGDDVCISVANIY